ncbi:MAG: FAD:protein FMN transferase [Candidatus Saccharimonadaceae bacterium]
MMRLIKSKPLQKHNWQFEGIGTKWEIVSFAKLTEDVKSRILQTVEAFDKTYSRFRPNSLLRIAGEASGSYDFPKSSKLIFDFYDELWDISEHKVTPMVGDRLATAGYDEVYSLKPNQIISPILNYKQILRRDGTRIQLQQKAQVDIGAVGKGFLIDEVTHLLKDEGHTSFIVDGSGDMRVVGEMIETVGLEDPRDTSQVIGMVKLSESSLCASASNRRAWGDWHHILDPTNAKPVQDIIATWVIAESAMVADGLATALFFVSAQKLAEQYTYEYARMHADGSVEYSNYFAKGVF